MDAIAKAMGLGGIDDLASDHRNVLQVEHFARLAPILDMVVEAIVNVASYTAGVKPNWLAVVVSLAYMVGGYFVTGRRAPDELFLAVVYGLLIVAPLAHVEGAVLSRLFGGGGSAGMQLVGKGRSQFFQKWW